MGPSDARGPHCNASWLRREDSNLQSPDPESGGLPISRLLSASLIYTHRGDLFQEPRRRGAPLPARSSVACRLIAQGFRVMVDEFVAALKQCGVLAVLLDHIAELAEVVYQQPLASLILVVLLERLQ
jgi:hypothetical protein